MGWGPIAKLLPLVDSFLLFTNEKPLFFPKPIQLVPKQRFLILIFLFEWREQRYWQKAVFGDQLNGFGKK